MLGMEAMARRSGPCPGAGPAGTLGPGQSLNQAGGQRLVGAQGGGVRPATPDDADTPQVTGLPGQQNTQAKGDTTGSDTPADTKTASSDSGGLGNQVFGGGPILGVASTSKAKTIREFNKKSHYNEWVFIYDPNSDRGGLLKGPIQPDSTGRGIGIGQGVGQGVGQALARVRE